ncbi:MAG: membrane protein insertase YidC [Proteobacteria bacterium]|nr:membrane protein insertase YidC [Pseudomonadota bacterium]
MTTSTGANLRYYLWGTLGVLLFINYQTWTHDFASAPAAAVESATRGQAHPGTGIGNSLGERVPAAATAPEPTTHSAAPGAPAAGTVSAAPALGTPQVSAPAPVIHVRTDVLDLDISTRGGTVTRADLLAYPKVKGEATPVRLENDDDAQTLYLLQSGLAATAVGVPAPTHSALYQAASSEYSLGSAAELRVPLTWSEDGIEVTKTFILRRGQYRIDLQYQVHNGSGAAWQVRPYAQILRNDPRTKGSMFNVTSSAFHGPALHDGTKYRKLNPASSDNANLSVQVTDGWIAALQHYFVTAIVPPKGTAHQFALQVDGNQYLLSDLGPAHSIATGASGEFGESLFVGPKLQKQLRAASPELGRVADYGPLWILAMPLFTALSWVHAATGNWGVAIILVTFLLKLLFYPLSEASGRSMAKMKTLQPRIKNLQETYADDREKLGRAMMDMYKREKINPVAGCLPMIIQIPVFLAFYWVLLESVEMRQAPFAFWIHDLSSRDPLFILPAIMAAAMFVQYKLNPAPPDPVQAKVFMFMPLVMSVTFAFFPAGLVLYWVTNTILSIAQQWNINRRIEAAVARKN